MSESCAARLPVSLVSMPGLTLLPPATRLVLRGAEPVMRAAAAAVGLEFSAQACRAVESEAGALLWLGPDERLLLLPERAPQALAALSAALGARPHARVDVSHRQVALQLTGPAAADILASGCPLDLDAAHFPVGMCTRTVLAKAEIILWRRGPTLFHIEVWRSFAGYVSTFLEQAARDLDGAPPDR